MEIRWKKSWFLGLLYRMLSDWWVIRIQAADESCLQAPWHYSPINQSFDLPLRILVLVVLLVGWAVGATAKFAASDDSHFIKHEWCHHPTIAALTSQPAPHPHFINKDNEMTKGPKVVVDTRLTTYYNTWLTSTISTWELADCLFTVCKVTRHTAFTATDLRWFHFMPDF